MQYSGEVLTVVASHEATSAKAINGILEKDRMTEYKDRRRRLTSNNSGLLENRLVIVKLSRPMIVFARMRGKGLDPAFTWPRIWRIFEL